MQWRSLAGRLEDRWVMVPFYRSTQPTTGGDIYLIYISPGGREEFDHPPARPTDGEGRRVA
jgi:hypothetical protein